MISTLKLATQNALIRCYNLAFSWGLLSTSLGRFLYKHAYFVYKRHLEAGSLQPLRNLVDPGSWVVDVGANIGFFSVLFCQWTSAGGRVLALEPEPRNYGFLLDSVGKWRRQGKVETLPLAVDCADGAAKLTLNPAHPGDHRLGTSGLDISTVTLDSVLAERNWPPVSLVKIDVQGAEMRVLSGAAETIARLAPAFFVELDASALARFGSSPQAIFTLLAAAGYTAHSLDKQGLSLPLSPDAVASSAGSRSYTDILFLPPRLRPTIPCPG